MAEQRRFLRRMQCKCGQVIMVERYEGDRIDIRCTSCMHRHRGIITNDHGKASLQDIPTIDWLIAHLGV